MGVKRSINRIVFCYMLIPLSIILLLYAILPKVLNYPPNSIDNNFQLTVEMLTYSQQFLFLGALCFLVSTVFLIKDVRQISNGLKVLEKIDNKDKRQKLIDKITKLCFKTPLKIYKIQVFVPLIAIPTILLIMGADLFVVVKISFIFVLFMSLSAVLCYIFSRNRFSWIVSEMYMENSDLTNKMLDLKPRIGIKYRLILELFPLVMISLFFTFLLSYVNISKTSGDIYYNDYKYKLEEVFGENTVFANKEALVKRVKEAAGIEDLVRNGSLFVIDKDGSCETLNGSVLSNFFIKYALSGNDENRTYDYYGVDREGTFIKINTTDGNEYLVGIAYLTTSMAFMNTLVVDIVLMFVIFGIILYITRTISYDIKLVTVQLNKITQKNKVTNPLIITSNDELGLLEDSFNKINNLTYEHIKAIEDNQYVMQRQAQFAVLGEFAGGLAHDLNSPLSAVKLDIGTLKKYINSDKITAEPVIKDKLNYMFDNIETSLTSMGDIILGVRNQIRSTGDVPKATFKLIDVVEGIKILFRSIFMKSNCQLVVNIPKNLEIYGEKNKLDRVISNVIKNSLDAYTEKGIKGIVEISASKKDDLITITIKDMAGGIPEEIQSLLFKEMKTTKSEKGTGFGLYYSNTIVESSFKGKMYFKTEQGVGTTFYIEIPNVKEDK